MSAYIDGDQTPLPGDAQASSDGRLHAASASTEPLRLHFESEHAATEACARLARFSIRCRRASLHSVLIETDAENCLHVLHHLEMAAAERALYSPGGDAKESVATQPGGTPIKSRPRVRALSPRSKQIWLARMLNEERLTCLFQPIVHCDETREVYGFESLMRGREDGALIAASQLLEVAR